MARLRHFAIVVRALALLNYHGKIEALGKDPDGIIFDISKKGWIGTR
jgi:hypothetical protein